MKKLTLLLILLLIPGTLALTTNKETYIQGELITITTEEPTLDISTPTTTYKHLGTDKKISFIAETTGTYTFTTQQETHTIQVTPGTTLTLRTAKGASIIHAATTNNTTKPIIPGIKETKLYGFSGEEIHITPNLGKKWGFTRTYAIDPTTPGFGTAELTLTATGTSLHKCTEYNYLEETCNGEWKFIRVLTPGEDYTITVNDVDPVFGEGDTQSQPDQCQYSDEAGQGDGDTNINCLAEVQANNSGTTTDIEDFEGSGGTSQILINWTNTFSVASINSIDVTYRYQRVTNTQVGATTATIQVWDSGAWTTACTDIAVNIGAWESYNCDLSTWVTTEAEANDVRTRILFSTAKVSKPSSNGVVNVDFAFLGIDFVYNDQTPPNYTSIAVSPPTPKTYNTEPINFSTEWSDDVSVMNVTIEHNFSTTWNNDTVLGTGTYTHSEVLGAGTYSWRQLANDTTGNLNDSMPYQTYTVTQATGNIELLINNTASNKIMYEDTNIPINGTRLAGEINLTLYENAGLIAEGQDIDLLRTYNTPGLYTLTLNISASQNYTFHEQEFNITVLDKTPPLAVTNLNNQSSGTSWIYWNWTEPPDIDYNHAIIEYNGTFYTNTSNNYVNISGLDTDTEYEIQVRTVDTSDNINQTTQTDLARTQTSLDIVPPKITNIQNSSITDSETNITWTTDEIADTLVKYGTSTGVYTETAYSTTDVITHNIQLTNLIPITTYYYVVNSTDPTGNTNQSNEYTFITLTDSTPPTYTTISVDPISGGTYPVNAEFNVTWSDNGVLANVTIEHNFTGTWKNDTMTGGPEYTYTTLLGAGNYEWRSIANDTIGNENNTMPYQTYVVVQATGNINLYLNGTDSEETFPEDEIINLTASIVAGEGPLEILENDTILETGNDPLTVLKNYAEPGTYNITARMNATKNYTYDYENHTLTITDGEPPNITLEYPGDGQIFTDTYVDFQFYVEDNVQTENCTLYINEQTNTTNTSITDGATNFIYETVGPGAYNWTVGCVDSSGNEANASTTFSLTITQIPVWIPTTATHNNDGVVTSDVNVSEGTTRATDKDEYIEVTAWNDTAPNNANITELSASCEIDSANRGATLFFQYNTGGGWSGDICGATQDAIGTFSCDLFAQGVDNVTEINNLDVRCVIRDGDGGPGARSTIDYIELEPAWNLIQLSDFNITDTNIITPVGVIEGEATYIYANVSNDGDLGGIAFVRFKDETKNVTIGENSQLIPAGEYREFNVTWNATIGRTNISVYVDPNEAEDELFETNNNASTYADINSWHTYYGSTEQRFWVLGVGVIEKFNWSNPSLEGNIYVIDQDATVSMLNLQALTRSTTDVYVFSDLEDADTKLGSTAFIDNINTTYSVGGALKGVTTFDVFGATIDQVPIVDSTNTTSFVTGILYDVDDDSNGEYDGEEDLVFITKVNLSKVGFYGTYDYEITIPALLRNDTPSIDVLELYIEVI